MFVEVSVFKEFSILLKLLVSAFVASLDTKNCTGPVLKDLAMFSRHSQRANSKTRDTVCPDPRPNDPLIEDGGDYCRNKHEGAKECLCRPLAQCSNGC